MSILEDTTPDSRIYLCYLIDRARGQYRLKVVENEAELQDAIQAIKARRARRLEMSCSAVRTPFTYEVFRTKEDYSAFKAQLEAEREKYEAQEYREHIKKECVDLAREAKVLEQVQSVCGQFDGKIINARFFKKMSEVCCCAVYENRSGLNFIKCNEFFLCVPVSPNAESLTSWHWPSGSRLDGAAAAEVLENCIQDRMSKIKELRASVRGYTAYLRKVRKIEKRIEELTNVPWCVRNFAKENHLASFYGAKYIWQ